MKTTSIYYAVLAIPAVLAASMSSIDRQSASLMSQMETLADDVKEACPDLPADCSDAVEELLTDLKDAVASKDKAMITSVLKGGSSALEEPTCAGPLTHCIEALKEQAESASS